MYKKLLAGTFLLLFSCCINQVIAEEKSGQVKTDMDSAETSGVYGGASGESAVTEEIKKEVLPQALKAGSKDLYVDLDTDKEKPEEEKQVK